jgi:glyoxylase-like metal-dependent hydrolase (beta-lactamase superfamily II)
VELAAGVQRLTAPNPGMMTGPGTNTYLLGAKETAVIDPGPAIAEHVDAIIDAAAGIIRWILVTHTHPDHSPAAKDLATKTGAALVGRAAPPGPHQDDSFVPDLKLSDGDVIAGSDFGLRCIHTPGHASNHFCFLQQGSNWLYTGDHVMSGSTVVIDPPDGDMRDYLDSLERLARMDISAIAPGHGDLIRKPYDVIRWIVDHRLKREEKVAAALAANAGATSAELVPQVYRDVDRSLHALAERSLLAHLIKLEKDGRASADAGRWRAARE